MGSIPHVLEELLRSPKKTLESLIPPKDLVKNLIHFSDEAAEDNGKLYYLLKSFIKVLNDYYFKVEHIGQFRAVKGVASKEKVLVISNHANTLEAGLIMYQFLTHGLGRVRPMVFKEAFRLPIVKDIFASGHCLPISIEAGKEALKQDHLLLFPEGMDFIKHFLKKDFVVKYHKGFLRIAQRYLEESGEESVTIQPVAHDGIDHTLKFWVLNHPTLVKYVIKPYLHYPYFVFPKMPILFPTTAVFNWGKPCRLTREDLEADRGLQKLADGFRNEMVRLRARARKVRQMIREQGPAAEAPGDPNRNES